MYAEFGVQFIIGRRAGAANSPPAAADFAKPPSSTVRPARMTKMRSALSIVLIVCATTMHVVFISAR